MDQYVMIDAFRKLKRRPGGTLKEMSAPTLSCWNRPVIGTGIGLLFVLGCNQMIGAPDRHVHGAPAESELVGVWRADHASLERLKSEGAERTDPADHFIDLRPDHSCSYSSYSYFPGEPFISDHACSWRLSKDIAYVHHMRRDVPAVELTLEKGYSITVVHYYIAREHDHLVLWEFIGDPDYNVYMDFRKSPL